MDEVAKRMAAILWKWGDKDAIALEELERRIARHLRQNDYITYSDLVQGVVFRVPGINNGLPYQVDVHNWSWLDRALVGEFLGYISLRSYRRYGFMASAVVVDKTALYPSDHFFKWMKDLAVLPDTEENTKIEFWNAQLQKAYARYRGEQ